MGAKSTVDISRSRALGFLYDHLDEVDDQTLAELVELVNDMLRDKGEYEDSLGLSNFHIVR